MKRAEWSCPGCGLPWGELPVGHSVPVATTFTAAQPPAKCSVSAPVSPADFVRLTRHPK